MGGGRDVHLVAVAFARGAFEGWGVDAVDEAPEGQAVRDLWSKPRLGHGAEKYTAVGVSGVHVAAASDIGEVFLWQLGAEGEPRLLWQAQPAGGARACESLALSPVGASALRVAVGFYNLAVLLEGSSGREVHRQVLRGSPAD